MNKWAIKQIIIGIVITLILGIGSGSLISFYVMRSSSITPEQILESTVLIEIDGRHTGSGFVVSSELIVTARHVVDRKGDYAVIFADGSKRNVQAIRISETADCAVLLVRKANLRPLKLTTDVEIGQPIFVIGSPLERAYFNYVTRGIVCKIGIMDDWLSCNSVIMIDAAVNPGNSGGPVFDLQGRVIGITIAGYVYNCGMNFITPSIDIITLLEEYNDEGENHEGRYKEDEEWFAEEYETAAGTS